jgi:proline iminopeptidase
MERFLDNAGTRLWSTCDGNGTGLILCNGGPGCDDYLGPVAALISDSCRVIRFEQRGCGRSDRDKRYDLATTIDDIEFLRRSYGLERPIIAGHSAGVNFALIYALKYPENVTGIIGISGGRMVNDQEWSRTYHENLEAIGEENGGKVFDADPDVNRVGNASWRKFITRPTLLRELSKLSVPAVFINAGADIRPNWPSMQLASLLPLGRYVEIANAGHYIWQSHSDDLQRELRAALHDIQRSAGNGSASTFRPPPAG